MILTHYLKKENSNFDLLFSPDQINMDEMHAIKGWRERQIESGNLFSRCLKPGCIVQAPLRLSPRLLPDMNQFSPAISLIVRNLQFSTYLD